MSLRSWLGQRRRSVNRRARPSKTYLHRLFDEDVTAYSRVGRAANIASADFKNAHLFESEVYYAVDVDEAALRDGLDSVGEADSEVLDGSELDGATMAGHRDRNGQARVAVLGDMRDPLFPPDSLDLITSTHTFGHVPPAGHPEVVENVCTALRPDGTPLLQLAEAEWYDGDVETRLEEAFERVETERYRTPISAGYERLVADADGSVVFPHGDNQVKHYLMMLAAAGLLQFEKRGSAESNSLYVRCTGYDE